MSKNETGANNQATGNQDIEVKKAISPSGKVVTPKVVSKGKASKDGRKRSNAEQEVRFWSPFGTAFKILPNIGQWLMRALICSWVVTVQVDSCRI